MIVSNLWLVHPGVVHASVCLRLLEGVRRVHGDVFVRVVQSHKAWPIGVALTYLLQPDLDDASRWRSHVEGVLASLHVVIIQDHGCRGAGDVIAEGEREHQTSERKMHGRGQLVVPPVVLAWHVCGIGYREFKVCS